MKRINVVRTISLVLLLSTLFLGCATPIDQQVVPPIPAEPVEVEQQSEAVAVYETPNESQEPVFLAVIEDPPRFWKYPPVKPFGNKVGVINRTGYTLKVFDLFNEALYSNNAQQVNLLEDAVEDGQRVVVDLQSWPDLLSELDKRDGSKFIFNARDWDNDLYWGEWDPQVDDWNLVIAYEQLEREWQGEGEVESFGSSLVIANATGYPIEKLFLERKRVNQMDGSETNLLQGRLLQDGKRARIQVSDLGHLAEYLSFEAYSTLTVSAYDTDGDLYIKEWHPTTDLWLIQLTSADMLWSDSTHYELQVENQTGGSIWYLYVTDDAHYQAGELGDDLLGMDILDDAERIDINLSQADGFDDLLEQPEETVMHVIAEGLDGTVHHATFLLGDAYPSVVFDRSSLEDFVVEEGEELTLYNDTPADLWFLYLATDEMVHEKNFGNDLLRDGIWEMKEAFTFKVSPALVEADQVLHLYAYDYLDNEYHKEWKVSDGWTLTFNADDLSTQ